MPRKSKSTNSVNGERLDRGIRRLELLTKLTWGFLGDPTNTLHHWDQLVLVELLEDITVDLQVGHRAISQDNNELWIAAHPEATWARGGAQEVQ